MLDSTQQAFSTTYVRSMLLMVNGSVWTFSKKTSQTTSKPSFGNLQSFVSTPSLQHPKLP